MPENVRVPNQSFIVGLRPSQPNFNHMGIVRNVAVLSNAAPQFWVSYLRNPN